MVNDRKNFERKVCPAEHAGALDNRLRRWIQNPAKLLKSFVQPGMTAVDFGCGPGFFTIEMAKMIGPAGKVIGVDLQQEMLDKVRAKITGTELEQRIVLHQCSTEAIGLKEPVDFVLAFYVLHELPDQSSFFTELAGNIKESGRILIVEPPFHVSASAFAQTIEQAKKCGFSVVAAPKILFSKTALLIRDRS
jgi:ubiquinone/menaquinone biosynthesis C-methylase UbiE